MLGHKLVQTLSSRFELFSTIRNTNKFYQTNIIKKGKIIEHINVENIFEVESLINEIKPAVIINAVGIIKQLPSSKNVITTLRINSIFPHQLAEISAKVGARLINMSTDCVFSGKKGKYIESDISDALDLYGKSKYLGEVVGENCLTLRTSIIGRELNTAHSLVEWFLSNLGKSVKGFTKAVYTGFPTIILADIIGNLIENFPELQGLYHLSSEPINKYDLLTLVRKAYDVDIEIEPFDEFEIDRSLNSKKFREETGFVPMDWQSMIAKMAADNFAYEINNKN